MQIIKEYCVEANTCVIRADTYGKSIEFIEILVEQAMLDFPKLKKSNIELIRYAGQKYVKTFGIEFQPIDLIPTDYRFIDQLEYTQ